LREIEQCIEQADGSAYMAIFVTTSTSYTPLAKYLADAKIEAKWRPKRWMIWPHCWLLRHS